MKCIKKKMTSETISPSSYQTSFISFLKWTKTNFFMQIVILAWFLIAVYLKLFLVTITNFLE